MRAIKITIYASKNIARISDYIELKWSEKVRKEFIKKVNNSINTIRKSPESFPKSESKIEIRKCVVTKQTTILYRFDSQKITIISFFDTRQNPSKINKIK